MPEDELTCRATASGGALHCVKPLYRAQNGEVWEHGGGHFFASDKARERLATGDYDAKVVLSSLRPATPDNEGAERAECDICGRSGPLRLGQGGLMVCVDSDGCQSFTGVGGDRG